MEWSAKKPELIRKTGPGNDPMTQKIESFSESETAEVRCFFGGPPRWKTTTGRSQRSKTPNVEAPPGDGAGPDSLSTVFSRTGNCGGTKTA